MILEIVRNKPELSAVSAFAPITISVRAEPEASVPTTVKLIPESSPADVIATFWAMVFVTDPPEANAPSRTSAAFDATVAATEIPVALTVSTL